MLLVGAAVSIFLGCADTDERFAVGRQQVIYGDDSRRDLYEIERESLRGVAVESTLALVSTRYLTARNGSALLTAPSLGEVLGLCPGEAFHAQPAAASCSGVLIDENLVLTAGHCVNAESACPESDVWITNYALHAVDTQPALVDSDVYRCRSMVFRVREVDSEGQRWDFAVIELDRPVTLPQRPVLLGGAALSMGQKVSVVGYPNGLPVKIDTGARISDLRSACGDYFELTADTFEGSSGSGVFDFEARLVGMIVTGAALNAAGPKAVFDESGRRRRELRTGKCLLWAVPCSNSCGLPAFVAWSVEGFSWCVYPTGGMGLRKG